MKESVIVKHSVTVKDGIPVVLKRKKDNEIMSEKRAERVIEEFENGSRNGEEWAHNVCLRRGTDKYEQSLLTLNEAFRIKSVDRRILPIPVRDGDPVPRKRPRR